MLGFERVGWRESGEGVNILLTGATSLIGRHVVKLLLSRGDAVTVVQRGECAIEGVKELRCDLSSSADVPVLQQAMVSQDAVVHLAAKVSIAGRWDAFEALNVDGVQRMVDAARESGVKRFVHVSSPSVAHAGQSLIGETAGVAAPDRVRGHYARSKAMGEQIALAANSEQMNVVSLRPHLVWGPGDQQLVQRIIDRAKSGRLLLVGTGQALIDTTYVDNAADAIVAGVDHIEQAAGRALVISNAQPRTVCETLQRIVACAALPVNLKKVPVPVALAAGTMIESVWQKLDRSDDPPMTRFLAEQLATAHWFDQRESQSLLSWSPKIGIDEGFLRLARFYREA